MKPHVLILTTESLPPWSKPTAGGGVRIWGIGEALDEAGCEVTYLVPDSLFVPSDGWNPIRALPFAVYELDQVLANQSADLLVVEQWQPLTLLRERPSLPTVIDLPGPLFLEAVWREPGRLSEIYADKIRCLSMADGVVVAMPQQKGYALAWAAAAGLDLQSQPVRTVPFSLPAMPPSRQGARGEAATFLTAGIFWPWLDIESGIRVVLERLDRVGEGSVMVIGGAHPHHQMKFTADGREGEGVTNDTPPGGSISLEALDNHPRLIPMGLLPFSEVVEELRRCTVAFDLSAHTVERELALAIRTGVALWAGCPVMVRPWSLWASTVAEHDAGWIVDDIHSKAFGDLIEAIARGQVDITSKRKGALQLTQAVMNPEKNIRELLDWVHHPPQRKTSAPLLNSRFKEMDRQCLMLRRELDRVTHDLERADHDLNSIRNHPLFKVYKAVRRILTGK